MENKEVLGLIKELAEHETKAGLLNEKLRKIYPFDECMYWGVTGIKSAETKHRLYQSKKGKRK